MKPRVVRRGLAAVLSVAIVAFLLLSVDPAAAHGPVIVRPGELIQAAVDAATPGTTIVVRPGTYAENVVISKDGIKLLGFGATLVPPTEEGPANACSFGPVASDGICVAGAGGRVSDVTVSGFTVRGFDGSGVIFFDADNPNVSAVRAEDNLAYGIARFSSSGGTIIGNRASGAEVAGIYVGDSPEANVLISANETFANGLFGFFLRDAANGRLVANHTHDNCVGAIVINDGTNAGNWTFTANSVANNNAFCESEGPDDPSLSGIGIALVNASDNTIRANAITGNVPSQPADVTGGVVVISTPDGQSASRNIVRFNVFRGNELDISWDGLGDGNVFRNNACTTSAPDGLC